MGRLERFEDRTRGHPVAQLVWGFLVAYVLIGTVASVTGASAAEAWLAPLPGLLAAGAGMASVRWWRSRRR